MGKKSNFDAQYGTPFVSPVVRVQYVSLVEPDSGHKYSRDKYCVTALLPKKDKAGLKELLDQAAEMAGCDIDEVEKHPLLNDDGDIRDGDDESNAQKEGHKGCYFFITSSGTQPETCIVNEDGEPEDCEPSEIYPGCYCQLILQPSLYDEGKVTFYLQAVMKVEEGERFKASRTDAKSLFANWAGKNLKKVNKSSPKVEEEETDEVVDEEEEAPKAKRGRPAKEVTSNGKSSKKAPIVEEEEEEETDEVVDEEIEEDDEVEVVATPKKKAPVTALVASSSNGGRDKKLRTSIKDLLD